VKIEIDSATGQWLRAFTSAVRARDYAAGDDLFHDEVVAFGTLSWRSEGRDQLRRQQWHPVWERTEGFDFSLADAEQWRDGELIVVASPWSSLGIQDDGGRFRRRGRATIVLSRFDGRLKALHTHFSMAPGSAA